MEGHAMRSAVSRQVEEVANAVTHGFGLVASLAALPLLIVVAARQGDAWAIVGASVFGASLVTVYATSTIYHSLRLGPSKELWRRLDHAAIYLLIAGTYTPFTLGALRGPWGWSLFGVVWGVAALGIGAKVVFGPRLKMLSTVAYLAMGWLVIIAIRPLLARVGWGGVGWLLAGGVAYSLGVIFYARDEKLRFGHSVWHLFVLGGSVCHAIAVAGYGLAGPHS
jgi:hemolysin III